MKKLLLVKSPGNNKGSHGYANKIESLASKLDVCIDPVFIETQEKLNELMDKTDSKCILLNPTNLIFPHEHRDRNVENNQVVTAIMSCLTQFKKNESVFLLMGYGTVGEPLFKYMKSLKYNVMPISSNANLTTEFVNQFDAIINCTDGKEVGYHYSGVVIDVSKNWKTKDKVSKDTTGDVPVEVIRRPHPHIISCGEIGDITTRLMLEGL